MSVSNARQTRGRKSPLTRNHREAAALIRAAKSVLISTHIRPDGDALGSMLGLALALERLGLRVARLSVDPTPDYYAFLPGADLIASTPPEWTADLGIVVDCDGLSRVNSLEPAFAALPHLIDIDHHATDRVFGEVQIIDSTAGACSELVYELLLSLDLPIDQPIATCLYTGILTDTGRFSYGNTTPRSLGIAAELVRAGAEPYVIARKVYAEHSIAAMRLLGVALSRITPHLDGRAVSSTIVRDDFDATDAVPADTEGIIDHLRGIGGPHVALLFVQLDNGEVRVSLRSDGAIDVSLVALALGGGGHAMAAGSTCPGTVGEVRARVLGEIEKRLPALSADSAA